MERNRINTHGGANRGQGRKPRPLHKWMATLRCSEQDWQVIQSISPEQRAIVLVAWAQANTECSGQAHAPDVAALSQSEITG
jgi:hypothetical protein